MCRASSCLPDEYLARNTAAQTSVEIIAWKGHCEVHERFTAADIGSLRESHAWHHRARPSGVPSRGHRRTRLHRIDRGDGERQHAAMAASS